MLPLRSFSRHVACATLDPVEGDEYLLDTALVRGFVADVRAAIADARRRRPPATPIRPRFAELLDDPDWLPERYQEGNPESGMGGGIGQWLLFRAGDRSLSLFALVVPSGSETPVHDHLAWGLVGLYRGTQDEEIFDGDLNLTQSRGLEPGDFYALHPAHRRHPPRPHDLPGDLGLDPPAHERHRLRLAPRLRPGVGREPAVPVGLRERRLRAGLMSLPPGTDEAPALQTLRWLIRPIAFMENAGGASATRSASTSSASRRRS